MDALFHLEPTIRSKRGELTPPEVRLMQDCKLRAQTGFFVGSFGGAFVGWLATKRLNGTPRVALCVGAAAATGVWLLQKSLESSVEHILSLQGTRVQRELANLLLKNHNDPWGQKRVFKYYYPEVVYTDSSADRPVYRWRYRHFFGDPITPQSTPLSDTPQSEETDAKAKDVKTTAMAAKQAYVNAGGDTGTVGNGNPFDLVFGHPENAEDVPEPNALKSLSRRRTRRNKQQRRRRIRHHQEGLGV